MINWIRGNQSHFFTAFQEISFKVGFKTTLYPIYKQCSNFIWSRLDKCFPQQFIIIWSTPTKLTSLLNMWLGLLFPLALRFRIKLNVNRPYTLQYLEASLVLLHVVPFFIQYIPKTVKNSNLYPLDNLTT